MANMSMTCMISTKLLAMALPRAFIAICIENEAIRKFEKQ